MASCSPATRPSSRRPIAGIAVHLLLVVAAVAGALVVAADVADSAIRVALVSLAGVLCAVTVFGRFPLGLGPVAASVPAKVVRLAGVVLAGRR